MPEAAGVRLRAGPAHFIVDEEPAYAPEGRGEHLYVHLEKEGLTTDQAALALGRALGVPDRAIGYAGRKDRWGITRQWFSAHTPATPEPAALTALVAGHLPGGGGRALVLRVERHRNKLRLGHLAGNRFELGLEGLTDDAATRLRAALATLAAEGCPNRFGAQRFGIHGATVRLAQALGRGDPEAAIAAIVDPAGGWRWGDPLPAGFRPGPEGRVLGALRAGATAASALAQAPPRLRQLAASAAQAVVFNAVWQARAQAGTLHRPGVGDVAQTRRGGVFVITPADLADAQERAAPGRFEIALTGPLPPAGRIWPTGEAEAWERAAAAGTGIDWAWFAPGAPLASPGERRALLVPLRAPPSLTRGSDGTGTLALSLPSGCYATEALAALGVAVPEDRRGESAA